MADNTLRPDQQELVAIGASVGAGCHPCLAHHVKAAQEAGVPVDRLRSALGSAEGVASHAVATMSGQLHAQFAVSRSATAARSLDEVLAGLGAALGANDRVNIEGHVQSAASLGATREQVRQAIDVAQSTQTNAMRLHRRVADRALDGVFGTQTSPSGDLPLQETGCGCQAEPTDEPVPA